MFVIQVFARWGSATILRYAQEAPLAASASIAARTEWGSEHRATDLRPPNLQVAVPQDEFGQLEAQDLHGSSRQTQTKELADMDSAWKDKFKALAGRMEKLEDKQEVAQELEERRVLNTDTGALHLLPENPSTSMGSWRWVAECGGRFVMRNKTVKLVNDASQTVSFCGSCGLRNTSA